MAVGYKDATLTIEIIERTADDVEGFRVTLDHDDGEWVGFGNKKVKVYVTRLNNSAYPWTRFENIAVALRDTVPVTVGNRPLHGDEDIYTLTASGLSLDSDDDLDFSITASAGGAKQKIVTLAIQWQMIGSHLSFNWWKYLDIEQLTPHRFTAEANVFGCCEEPGQCWYQGRTMVQLP